MSEDKKGWEFADGLECLSYHQKNSSWTGKLLSNTYRVRTMFRSNAVQN